MDRAGIPNRYMGNPMMDDLEPSDRDFDIPKDSVAIGMLPGSRPDAETNLLELLAAAAATHRLETSDPPMQWLVAAHGGFDIGRVAGLIEQGGAAGWRIEPPGPGDDASGIELRLIHEGEARVWIVRGRFVDLLDRSNVVIGLAGMANEQAVGMGKPLINVPTRGVQGRAFVKMKMEYFGESALMVEPDSEQVARAIVDILRDPQRQIRMAAAGRERMGEPGASQAIADEIIRAISDQPVEDRRA